MLDDRKTLISTEEFISNVIEKEINDIYLYRIKDVFIIWRNLGGIDKNSYYKVENIEGKICFRLIRKGK